MVTYLQLIYNLQQLPKPKHQEEKALSGDVLPSRCSQQKLSGLAEEIQPGAALPCSHSPQHSCPPPWPCLQKQRHQQSWGCSCGRGPHGETKSFSGPQNNIWESTEGQSLGSLQILCEGASCSEGSRKAQASRLPEVLMGPGMCNNCDELCPGMGSSRWDETHTHQSPMWAGAPSSRGESCCYLSTANHAGCWAETALQQPGQHRAAQGGAGREAAALPIPGPQGQLITLAQLTKVPS